MIMVDHSSVTNLGFAAGPRWLARRQAYVLATTMDPQTKYDSLEKPLYQTHAYERIKKVVNDAWAFAAANADSKLVSQGKVL